MHLILEMIPGLCAYDRMRTKNSIDNTLSRWRLRKRLTRSQVEIALSYSRGTIAKYEALGLTRIPCNELARIIKFYGVTNDELRAVLDSRHFFRGGIH